MKKKTVESKKKIGGEKKKKMKTKTKTLAIVEIAIVLCSVLLVAPAIAAEQTTQKVGASAITTTASEDDFVLEIFGNANEDDTIDMRDTTYIKLVIFGKKPETELADANYDGKVSMLDVGQTKLIILGKEKKLTLIDLTDKTVTINKPVERIVMTFSFEEPIAVDGKDIFKKIVGWNRGYWEGRRQWIWEKYTKAFPEIEAIPDVGYPWKGTFNVEKVITLKPDVVIMVASEIEHAETAVKQLEQADIPTICMDYHAGTLEAYTKSTLMLGYVFDKEQIAQEIVEFYIEQVNEVYSRIEKIDNPKPKVFLECGYKKSNSYGNYMGGALIEKAGGINVAKGVIETFGTINPEFILTAKPDIIVIEGSYWPAYEGTVRLGYYADIEESRELLKAWIDRPGWGTLSAVKNNRIYAIHLGFTRHIYDFTYLQALAKWFYPDEFGDLDPEESFKEFHERFLPVDYSGVWMLSLEE